MLHGVILAALLQGAAEAPHQFDLVCDGVSTLVDDAYKPGPPRETPWSEHFRVDLDRQVYCRASECAEPHAIFEVLPDIIRLNPPNTDVATIDRTTGSYSGFIAKPYPQSSLTIKGVCKRAVFTAMPQKMF